MKLTNGAFDILEALKGQVKLALASMNNKAVIKKHLKMCRLEKYFDVVLSSDEIIEPKPSPDIFMKCAKSWN
ncbi:HAD-IA family hydrolase [Candidatus Bathyarchaeota archaeon]|nr:HAD-IA family hydrolase [Candidatus Bathyarchaeota archaeon]